MKLTTPLLATRRFPLGARSSPYTTNCRHLSTNTARDSQKFILPDGRVLGFTEAGSPTGYPLIYFHGFPSSRLEAASVDELCRRQNFRIVGPDRPGFGISTFQPGRRIMDWPADVTALVKHLGISRLAVMGGSGGGAYALACAHAMPRDMISAHGL